MTEDIKVLSSKLTVPRTTDTIERDRLLSLMNDSVRKKLTTIVAGAGYGKTTLAAQASRRWRAGTVWYRLDESDRDLVTFLSYLVAGLRRHYPEFGSATLRSLRGLHNPTNGIESVLVSFMREMEDTVTEELMIVLDDFHSVKEGRQINEAVTTLLRDLPPLLHLILTSRSDPSLPLSRLRAMREVVDIGEEDLAFDRMEIEELCTELFDFSPDSTCADTICLKTGGWVAGLILLCHSLRGKAPAEVQRNLVNLRGSQRSIFNYLEENIYRALSLDQKKFLVKTAILPRINAEFCDRFLSIDYSKDMLRYLEGNHLFTSAVDEERQWYSYHQLFRDFLMSILQDQRDHNSIAKLHRDAAALMEACGEEEEAVQQYLSAEEFEKACILLEQVGRRLFSEGRFQLLSSYLDRIPSDSLDAHPRIRHLQGQLLGLSGKPGRAIEKYGQAFACFLERKDEEGVQSCLLDLGLIHLQTGHLKTARRKYEELLDRKPLEPQIRIEALGYQIYLSSCFWEMDVADRCYDEAMALLEKMTDDELRHNCLVWIHAYRAFRYLFSLDFARAIEIAEYARGISPDSESKRYPLGFYLLLPIACLGLRLYSRGYEIAEEGLSIIREGLSQTGTTASGWHSPRLSSGGLRERGFPETLTPWLLAYSAANAAELGKIAEALDAAGGSLKYFHGIGCRMGEAYCHSVLSRAHLKSGNRAAAEQWARSGLEAARGLTIPRIEGMLRFSVAESLVVQGELEEALRFITEADRDVKEFWIKALYVQIGKTKDYSSGRLHKLLGALQSYGRRLFDPQVIFEQPWIIGSLIKLLGRDALRPRIQELASGMRPEAAAKLARHQTSTDPIIREVASLLSKELTTPSASTPGLKICLLGKFRIICGGEELQASRWKSRKARTLFQYLVSRRPRGYLNKELLMELLWPEEDPILTSKRFHVALASLRRTLEPHITKGTPSSYIIRVGEAYTIDPGKDGWVDIEAFGTALRQAREENDSEKALPHLLKAESLYSGDFLEEEIYSEWCCEPRERYRKDYLYLTKRVMTTYERLGRWEQCIEFAEKHLEVDKYAEDIYRTLMRCYWKTGDLPNMTRTFRNCRDSIAVELNCGLSEETEMLYRELTSTRKGISRRTSDRMD